MVFGIIQSRNVKLSEVASEVQNSGKDESKITQFRRWLANEAITFELYYLPFLRVVLTTLANTGQPLVLVIDGSATGRGCVTLMVSVVYQNRALPLMWITRKGRKGHFPENIHVELIKTVRGLIPQGCKVICLGDGEFDGTDWLETLQQFGWSYACRTAKTSVFYEDGERFVIQDICPARGDCTGISGVLFTERQYGPVTAIAWWGMKYKDQIYLVSNFTLPDEACFWYTKRFRIETMFSDFKGRGFHLQKTGLRDPERVSRLLYAVALAYIWLVFLGKFALDTPWHKRIHRNDRCDLSLFQLGKRLLKLLLREGIAIPDVGLLINTQPTEI